MPGTQNVPLTKPNNNKPHENENDYNALIFACENKGKIDELASELKTVCTSLDKMREDIEKSFTEQNRGLLAIYGALHGSQIDDIKHNYNLQEVENKMISNGLAWAADIKYQKNQPRYRDAVMRYHNQIVTSTGQQVTAPAASYSTASAPTAATTTPSAVVRDVQPTAEPATELN